MTEHEVVALLNDRPEGGLQVGDVGTIVHCDSAASSYEIEFVDESGRTKCVATVPASQIMKLNLLSLSA
jgi:hypothetical protein